MAELAPMIIIDAPEGGKNVQLRRRDRLRRAITTIKVYMKITDETIFNPFKAATLIRVFVVIGVGLLLIGGWEVGSR